MRAVPPPVELPRQQQAQQLTLFIRATNPGEDILAGISTRRLVAVNFSG